MMYYIHGYLSSPQGAKGTLFQKTLNASPIIYRTCEPEQLRIPHCLDEISKIIKDDPSVSLIGSSLGGFLAAKTALTHQNVSNLILLNPAIIPPTVDITNISDMPQAILKDMQDETLFQKQIMASTHLFIGTKDTVVPNTWGILFAKKQEASIRFLKDDHQLSIYLNDLPTLITSCLRQKS